MGGTGNRRGNGLPLSAWDGQAWSLGALWVQNIQASDSPQKADPQPLLGSLSGGLNQLLVPNFSSIWSMDSRDQVNTWEPSRIPVPSLPWGCCDSCWGSHAGHKSQDKKSHGAKARTHAVLNGGPVSTPSPQSSPHRQTGHKQRLRRECCPLMLQMSKVWSRQVGLGLRKGDWRGERERR